jgi:hypothetical protein
MCSSHALRRYRPAALFTRRLPSRVRFMSCNPSSTAALHTRQDHRLSAVYEVEIDEGGKGPDRIGADDDDRDERRITRLG